ncbi:Wzz/FepE/Etk N-terminal domain-containing protein [Candidatus Neomarinimicrobiota bacterium]
MNKINKNFDEWDEGLEIDFNKILLSLKIGVKWLIVTPLVFCAIAIIYVLFIAKPVYTSEAKILLVGNKDNQSSLLGLASQFGFSIPPRSSDGSTYLTIETLPEILKSRSLTNSLLFSEFTTEKASHPEILFNIIFDSLDIADSDSNKLIAEGQDYIAKKVLGTKQINNTAIFSLYVNSPEAKLSAKIAKKVVSELEKMQLEFTRSELSDQKEFFIGRLSEVQVELYNAESRLKNYREKNLQINLSPTLLLEQERLEREIEIQTEIYISLKQQFEQIKISENKNISHIKVIDEPNIPIFRSKPKRKLIVLVAGILGLMIGGVVAIISNKKRDTIN